MQRKENNIANVLALGNYTAAAAGELNRPKRRMHAPNFASGPVFPPQINLPLTLTWLIDGS